LLQSYYFYRQYEHNVCIFSINKLFSNSVKALGGIYSQFLVELISSCTVEIIYAPRRGRDIDNKLLLPFQGAFLDVIFTQGVALGLELLGFQPDFLDVIFTQGNALGLVLFGLSARFP